MPVCFQRGDELGRSDLNIFIEDDNGAPRDPAEISFQLLDVTTGYEVRVGPERRPPVNPSPGEYYAGLIVPKDANLGGYRIRWTFRETPRGQVHEVVQEFDLVEKLIELAQSSSVEAELIRRLRLLLRDNNPDRNYHFRPPTHEPTVNQYSQVFGFIWEDEELREYLDTALDMIGAAPPETPFCSIEELVRVRPHWRSLLLTGAMMHAVMALILNWVSEEFGYSIGGISLDLDKSSKYESAYQTLSDQFDKQLERVKDTVKITLGLKQHRYGIGQRFSSLMPHQHAIHYPARFMGF
jgi:hypothetical protein